MFQCRLSLALGILPSQLGEISVTDYDLLQRYWIVEPWGSYRDNLHAAIIAREVRRTAFKGQHRLEDFMVRFPEKGAEATVVDHKQSIFSMFRALAGNKRTKAPKP